MGSLNPFKKVKTPAPVAIRQPEPLPEPVTAEASAEDVAASQEEQKKKLRTQRGRAATILSGGRTGGAIGDDSTGGLATKRLLGG